MSFARLVQLRKHLIDSRKPKQQFESVTRGYAKMADPKTWKLNHTMLRVKDPKRSVQFYEFLGMKLVNKLPQPEAKFDLYFLAYDGPNAASPGAHWTDREGVIELTHNYGTEDDAEYTVNNGNKDPHKGFGHVCVSVDNIQAACQRIEDAGYKFQKKLSDVCLPERGCGCPPSVPPPFPDYQISLILTDLFTGSHVSSANPDGYWVEIIGQKPVHETESVKTTDTSTYKMNHSMIRVKDAEKSLKYYQDVMGMTLMRTSENKDASFNLYFLGYGDKPSSEDSTNGVNPTAHKEGLLELTWNYGTEKENGPVYHNGNDQPQGFGHICVSVDDLDAACEYMDKKGTAWKKRRQDGRMKDVAFALDPDNYWIEVIQNQRIKRSANW